MIDSETILRLLVSIDVRIVLLTATVVAVLAMFRRLAAPARHLVWLNVFIASLVLPILTHSLPDIPLPLLSVASSPVAIDDLHTSAFVPRPTESRTPGTAALILVVYVSGVLFLLLGQLAAIARLGQLERRATRATNGRLLQRLRRASGQAGLRRSVRLLLSDAVETPLTWGLISPRIVLPATARHWSLREIDSALSHELAHIRRLDWPVSIVSRVLCALHWYNPALWFAARQLSLEAEKSCDDVVLQSGSRASDYAGQLVSLAAQKNGHQLVAGIGLGQSELARRVAAILDPNQYRSLPMAIQKPLIAASVLSLACTLAACQVTAASDARGNLAGETPIAAVTNASTPPALDTAPGPADTPQAAPRPAPAVAAVPRAQAPAPVSAAKPAVAPSPPAVVRPMEHNRLEMEEHARQVERQRRELHDDIEYQRAEMQRMQKQLNQQRLELEKEVSETRRQFERERERMRKEREHLERERQLLEEESRQRLHELERLEQERDET